VKTRNEFSWLRIGSVELSCEHGLKQEAQCICCIFEKLSFKWWHLNRFCMVWFGRSVSHREPNKLLHFAAILTTFNATSQRLHAIFCLPYYRFILSLCLPLALFTSLLFTRKLCQHWWRKHQLLYLTLEPRPTKLQRAVLETRLCHSPEKV
jgi:hypothetical protein